MKKVSTEAAKQSRKISEHVQRQCACNHQHCHGHDSGAFHV